MVQAENDEVTTKIMTFSIGKHKVFAGKGYREKNFNEKSCYFNLCHYSFYQQNKICEKF